MIKDKTKDRPGSELWRKQLCKREQKKNKSKTTILQGYLTKLCAVSPKKRYVKRMNLLQGVAKVDANKNCEQIVILGDLIPELERSFSKADWSICRK